MALANAWPPGQLPTATEARQSAEKAEREMQGNIGPMLCPVCKVSLAMSERQGIEIDFCPQCRGVWLDRGELDKISERSVAEPLRRESDASGYDDRGRHGDGYRGKHGYRRKSWLHELFD